MRINCVVALASVADQHWRGAGVRTAGAGRDQALWGNAGRGSAEQLRFFHVQLDAAHQVGAG
jgi:hypothetical protein